VCEQLRDGSRKFHSLQLISGVDYKEHIEVVYILCNFETADELILKTQVPRSEDAKEELEIDSVCSIWEAANFQERECYDMLGVRFRNHPDMRRILCPDDWEGFPLRKDYVAQEQWHGITIYPENKSNKKEREFAAIVKAEEKKKLAEEKARKAAAEAAAKAAEENNQEKSE
jgi:NADH-quinone oxidoreductase subunit C